MSDNKEKMVDLDIELTDEEFLSVAKMAHEKDITFNQMVAVILERMMNEFKDNPSKTDDADETDNNT